jgi:hypothetical protein
MSDLWQPVESKLPDPGTRVLVYGSGGVTVAYIDDMGNWRRMTGRHRTTPSHWMPSPEPPVEKR